MSLRFPFWERKEVMMSKLRSSMKVLTAGGIAALVTLGIAAGINTALADGGPKNDKIHLDKRTKTIVIDNLDTSVFDKGDPAVAATAQEVCGDCHSTDYPTTQPKLNCAGWGKEIVKMGNTFGAVIAWNEDGVSKDELNEILPYLTDNYGSGGSSACTGHELDPIQLNQ